MGKLENAVDFVASENTIVLAAAPGIVTYVKDDSDIGGPSINFWASNFISIEHQNEEYTRYDHLAFGSSKVNVGEFISAGQEIDSIDQIVAITVVNSSTDIGFFRTALIPSK